MKKFLVNSICGLLAFQLVLLLVFCFAKKGVREYNATIFEKCSLLFDGGEAQDLLFLGSSRTFHGIDPAIIEKHTGKKAVNAGFEGAKIHEMEMVLQAYLLTHKQPEKIFLMLDIHSLDVANAGIYNKLFFSQYLHNAALYSGFKRTTGLRAAFWKYLPYSIITEYDDYTRGNCIKGLAGTTQNIPGETYYKGYQSLPRFYASGEAVVSMTHATDENGMNVLFRIADTCTKRGIPLQIIQGPYLEAFYATNKVAEMYETINTRLSSYSAVTTQTLPLNYSDTSSFKDQVHLNASGAEKYSHELYYAFLEK